MSKIEFRNFLGIDNTTDSMRIPQGTSGTYLKSATNVDIDDEKKLHRRLGLGELVLSGTHKNLWTNSEYFLGVYGGNLVSITETGGTFSRSILKSGVGTSRMHYVEIGHDVFWTNETDCGYIRDGVNYDFPDPDQTFKTRMPNGHLNEYFNARYYVARDEVVFYSDAAAYTRRDTRGNFLMFSSRVKMMKAVTDGMYISAEGKVFFYEGLSPLEFRRVEVYDAEALEDTAVKNDEENEGDNTVGTTIYFATPSGIFRASNSGRIENITPRYNIEDMEFFDQNASIKDENGFSQYALFLRYSAAGSASVKTRQPKIHTEIN